MTLPSLLVSYSGDHGIYPSESDAIAHALATQPARVEVEADHYGFPADSGRDVAVGAIADWLDG